MYIMKKKTLGFLLLMILIASCSGDNEVEPRNYISDQWTELAEIYSIDRERVIIDGYNPGMDATFVFFNGRIDGRLWIGGYEKETKKNILDWTESTKLDTLINVDLGFGDKGELLIDSWHAKDFRKHGNYLCFILTSLQSGYKRYSDLYFLNINNFIAKHRKSSLSSGNNDAMFWNLIEWSDGILAEIWKQGVIRHECYDMNGVFLYSTPYYMFLSSRELAPIDYEEYMQYTLSDTGKAIRFLRSNLKTGETIWKNAEETIIDNSEEIIRIDGVSIEKGNLIWVYTVNYTRYSGEKRVFKANVNIQTGEVKE